MSEDAFVRTCTNLATTVSELDLSGKKIPSLIMLYASIDIISSASRPITQDDTDGNVFMAWAKKYIIDGNGFNFNEMDLWGARCGLLHTHSVESKKSRQNIARKLQYIGGKKEPDLIAFLQQESDAVGTGNIMVHFPSLIDAYLDGIAKFTRDIKADPDLKARVIHHAASYIVHERHHIPIPPEKK